MKKKCLLTGMAIVALLFCLMLLGCWIPEDDGPSGEGSSKEQAITLTATTWTEGNLAANGVQWYKFMPISIFSHYIHILFDTLTNVNVTLYLDSGYEVSKNNLYGSTDESKFTGFGALLIMGCVSIDGTNQSGLNFSNSITVNYLVENFSKNREWTVIIYKDILGNVEEELFLDPGESWSKDVVFRLSEYGSEHLSVVAHSLYGTFKTTITVKEINKSIQSGSRIKDSGREYFSLSQMHIDRETVKKYR